MIQFPDGKYRSTLCHSCRFDDERAQLATSYDEKPHASQQQILKCLGCGALAIWWWFAKLPLTQAEKEAVMNKPIRPGRAF